MFEFEYLTSSTIYILLRIKNLILMNYYNIKKELLLEAYHLENANRLFPSFSKNKLKRYLNYNKMWR